MNENLYPVCDKFYNYLVIFTSITLSDSARKVGVAKSKSTAVSPRDAKLGIFEGDIEGVGPTFHVFSIFGVFPIPHSYKLAINKEVLLYRILNQLRNNLLNLEKVIDV